MGRNPEPAIRTAYDERYADCDLIERVGEDTTFHRGLGRTGTRVDLIDMEPNGGCPRCSTDEMVVARNLNPDGHDDAEFYCTNIRCPHFVADAVETEMNLVRADSPERWDQTVFCPECEHVRTEEVRRHGRLHEKVQDSDLTVIEDVCDDCIGTYQEADA